MLTALWHHGFIPKVQSNESWMSTSIPLSVTLSGQEIRGVFSLAAIFALRMFGLFAIYPVFAIYARNLPDATPFRIGLALGIYGLAQALCQIPLGLLSDRMGRKPVIAAGLVIFAGGERRCRPCSLRCRHRLGPLAAGHGRRGLGDVGFGGRLDARG